MSVSQIEQLSFRAAVEADIPFLLELRQRTMNEHLSASGIELSDYDHSKRVLARFDCAQIVLLSDESVGLLKVARDGKEWELVQIQIIPEKQGVGLGGWIVQNLIDEAVKAKASLNLSVLKANPARHLYERLGFRVVKISDHAYKMRFGT